MITRALRRVPAIVAALALAGCATAATPPAGAPPAAPAVREADVRAQLTALAHDSMEGRFTGSPGMWRAARYIAAELRAAGVRPAGDDGFYQRMPLAVGRDQRGQRFARLLATWADTADLQPGVRGVGVNVVGIIPGSDPALREEAVLIDAHYDHLAMGSAGAGDTIHNGADDDASGVVAVLQIARAMAAGPPPRRTVIFLLTTGEEVGLAGTEWYIAHPVVPLERTSSNLEVEMIGRPDSLAGGAGQAWLTGYERSTMGDILAAAGLPIVADPRPAQNFFERSDNIAFARRGIPAHTLSSFNLHDDYHTVDDEVERIDFPHMTGVIRAALSAARLLADGPAPRWKPGGRPGIGNRE
jgi:hypothetical protein